MQLQTTRLWLLQTAGCVSASAKGFVIGVNKRPTVEVAEVASWAALFSSSDKDCVEDEELEPEVVVASAAAEVVAGVAADDGGGGGGGAAAVEGAVGTGCAAAVIQY